MDLISLRSEIDTIDHQLLQLFQRRMEIVGDVARYKQKQGIPIHHPQREQQILDWAAAASDPELSPYTVKFFKNLMEVSRSLQQAELADTPPARNE